MIIHIGGLAAAADKGMNVLGAAGAKAVLNEVLKAARPDKTLVFDGVSPGKKHVLEDAHHRVEIYNIGDNPHAQELLTVYIPEEKLLFQADMFTNREYQEATAPANEGGIAFVRWLKKQNLMTEHIAGAHGTVASRADINLMLTRAGEALQL